MGGTLAASLKAGWSQWEKCGIIVVYFGVCVRRPTSSRPCRVLTSNVLGVRSTPPETCSSSLSAQREHT